MKMILYVSNDNDSSVGLAGKWGSRWLATTDRLYSSESTWEREEVEVKHALKGYELVQKH